MTKNCIIQIFKNEIFRLGLSDDCKNVCINHDDVLQFELYDDIWHVPFIFDSIDEIKKIETSDEFIDYLRENYICIWEPLRDSLWDSLRYSFWDTLREQTND